MSRTTSIWAYKPLPELNGQTGFVECEENLAAKLLASGDVQDPQVGALNLREIEAAVTLAPPGDAHEYETTALKPAKTSKRPSR